MNDRHEMIERHLAGWTKTELAEHFGVSWRCVHKWVERFEDSEGDWEALEERSRRPHHSPRRTPQAIVDDLLRLKRKYQDGPAKLIHLFDPEGKPPLAASTAGDILKRNGMVRPRKRRRPSAAPTQRPAIVVPGPGHTMTADYKGQILLGNRQYCFPLTIADPASRYVLAIAGLTSTAGQYARPVFERIFREYGVPDQIVSDNGPPFCAVSSLGGLSELSKWWIKIGSRPIRIQPGKPQQNGIHERMHRTLKEKTAMPPAHTMRGQQRRFDAFREHYNQIRPHQALGQKPPAKFVKPYARPYPRRIPDLEYPGYFQVRSVRSNGQVKWQGQLVFLSEVLTGERVGFEQLTDERWAIYFGPVVLAHWDDRNKRVTRIEAVGDRTPQPDEECDPRPDLEE